MLLFRRIVRHAHCRGGFDGWPHIVYTPVSAMPRCAHRPCDGHNDSLLTKNTDRQMQSISLTHMGDFERQQAFDPNHFAPSIIKRVRGALCTFSASRHSERVRREPFPLRTADLTERSGEESSKSIHLLDSVKVHNDETPSKVVQISEIFSSYDRRLRVLEEEARLDGYSLNDASKKAFFVFCWRYPLMRRARLVLMENGNLRATWKDDEGAHVGLQFQNSQSIQFVIFGRRRLDSPVSRVTGRVSMDGIMRQIDALDVRDAMTYAP